MGQKSNPISLRLQYSHRHFDSHWYSDKYYAQCLIHNLNIQDYSKNFIKLLKLPETRSNITLGVKNIQLYSFFCIPKNSRFVRSRKFRIQSHLSNAWNRPSRNTKIHPIETIHPALPPQDVLHSADFPTTCAVSHDIERNKTLQYFMQQNTSYNDISTPSFDEQIFQLKYFLMQYYAHLAQSTTNASYLQKKLVEFFDISTFSTQKIHKDISIPIQADISPLYQKYSYQKYIANYQATQTNVQIQHTPFRIQQDMQSAGFLADEIVYFLEKKVSFARIKNRIFQEAETLPWIRGIRIKYSGRVGGKSKKAQRAKHECVKYGQTSLHVFDHQIDYASRKATTSFGSVGIKVWICYT